MTEKDPRLEQASRHLAGQIGDDLYWLAEGQKRNFIDPFTTGALAYLLMTEFLKAAAAAAGAGAGKLLWDQAVKLVREILAGRHKPDPAALQTEAETARGELASLSEAARDAAIGSAQDSLRDALTKLAPHSFAANMAEKIKQAAHAALGA